MTWTAYQVSFRLVAPLHVGWRKLGNLQQTRSYLTGRNFWGALTARLTRENGRNNYPEVGRDVDNYLAFTYFYPSTQPDKVSLWPWPDNQEEFAWKFLGSYVSTAMENGHSAEEGSLHETEFIAPYTRDWDASDQKPQPVYLVGYIFEKDSLQSDAQSNLKYWQEALNKLQFGGDRNYGWGQVRLYKLDMLPEDELDKKYFDYTLILDKDFVQLRASKKTCLLAHTQATESADRQAMLEPLVGRETNSTRGFGRTVSTAEICWIPGGDVSEDEIFEIQPKGVWRKVNNS